MAVKLSKITASLTINSISFFLPLSSLWGVVLPSIAVDYLEFSAQAASEVLLANL